MKVVISNRRLASVFSSEKSLQRKFGQEMAKRITMRVTSLYAAHSLGDFWPPYSGPERCHELKGTLDGYFSLDLRHPYRLLIRPLGELSKKDFPHEKDRWNAMQEVKLEKILNTHE